MKPTIFFSHSSRDKVPLGRLKDMFVDKTGGSIDVFLSSDGQSIPIGRNWVHKIQEALERTELMIVFVTPESLRSNWLYFESGFAYSKEIRVVPVGFLGVDLANVGPPLSLLQGFNIFSVAGLNNIIAIANKPFKHAHAESFKQAEFEEVVSASPSRSSEVFGKMGHLIDEVNILIAGDELNVEAEDVLNRISRLLEVEGLGRMCLNGTTIISHGMTFKMNRQPIPHSLEILLDPTVADTAFPLLEEVVNAVRKGGVAGTEIRFHLVPTVTYLKGPHKITARLVGLNVELEGTRGFKLGDLEFRFGRAGPGVFVAIITLSNEMKVSKVRTLLEHLFDREILFNKTESI